MKSLFLAAALATSAPEETLFRSLDPHSLAEHLAFYTLYPNTKEGDKALVRAWDLLSQGQSTEKLFLPQIDIQPLISLVTRQSFEPPVKLPAEQLTLIQTIASHFPNKKLKGANTFSREEVLALPNEEIDLARGILIYQFETQDEVLQYEATLDLIALQIEARLPKNPCHEDKIHAINRFIFEEMQFRFPPHSLYATDIDLYTFLPSVLDSRQGVCLGVSILYFCLAQRLDLPLEIITPPGHIFPRYKNGDQIINIETTARGIHLPSEQYLGINTRSLPERTLKEVIGMAFFNQASVFWSKSDTAKTVELYEKAMLYMPDDPLVHMLLGFNYLFIGKKSEGLKLLTPLKNLTFDHAISAETMPADILTGKVDSSGIQVIFKHVDEKRTSILDKQKELKTILKKFPEFRAGLFQLAVTYLQLNRTTEALEVLHRYHRIDPTDATVAYYLAALSLDRQDLPRSWHYLKQAEQLTNARDHQPKALLHFRKQLRTLSPE